MIYTDGLRKDDCFGSSRWHVRVVVLCLSRKVFGVVCVNGLFEKSWVSWMFYGVV